MHLHGAGGHSGATIAVLAVQYMWVLRRPWGLTASPCLLLALAARPPSPPLDWTNSTSFVDSARPASRIRLTVERQAHWQWHGLSLLGWAPRQWYRVLCPARLYAGADSSWRVVLTAQRSRYLSCRVSGASLQGPW
jgi:hypothetical protein